MSNLCISTIISNFYKFKFLLIVNGLINMTTINCNAWRLNPLINPATNRPIKRNGPTFKKLQHLCSVTSSRSRRSPSPSSRPSSSRSRRSPSPSSSRSRRSPSPSSSRSRRSPSPSPSRSRRSPSPQPSSENRREIYCGNNSRDQGLLNGTKIIGTRYQCLKKGIGKGLREPILEYNDQYEPIENTRIFCGNGDILPQNKDRFGTRDECLRKGYGVGQNQKYNRDGRILQQGPVITRDRGWYKLHIPGQLHLNF
jgi:hypothetical protein